MQDLSDFKALFDKINGSFPILLEKCKQLEFSKDPKNQLKIWTQDKNLKTTK